MTKIKWMLPVFLMLATSSVCAAADFDVRITNLDGTPIVDEKGKELELTVRTVVVNALMSPPGQDETNMSGEEKLRRVDLARRVAAKDANTQVFSSEDIALIKKLVNRVYPSPLVVEQSWRALETKK